MRKRPARPPVLPATTFGQVIGSVLQNLRKAAELQQASLAAELGLKQGGYSRLECGSGHITISQLRRAASTLRKDARWVLEVADKSASQLEQRGIRIIEEVPAKVPREEWMLVSETEVHDAVRTAITVMSRYVPPIQVTHHVQSRIVTQP